MKPQNLHAHEDRLLDFAYGELPPQEAHAVQSHLEGCERCTEALAGIRGVRSTMAQLSVEPAPDAGLESLLAYAQQAARNAAAGPAPRPTWWRRWLVPACGVAAVSVFGLVTLRTNEKVNLAAELMQEAPMAKAEAGKAEADKAEADKAEAPAAARPEPAAPRPAAPEPPSPVAEVTPPPPAPAVKLDSRPLQKEGAARQKAKGAVGAKDVADDWSNTGSGAVAAREAYEQELAESKSSQKKSYEYDRRDAMTQAGAFPKPKPMLATAERQAPAMQAPPAAAPAEPASPAAAPAAPPMPAPRQEPEEEASADDELLAEAPSKQQAPARDSALALGGSRASKSKREERSRSVQAPSATQSAQAYRGQSEEQEPSVAELSRQADAALRAGNRVREAQLLRQALAAGALGRERLGLLNRLCDAEFAIGRRKAAIEACSMVLEEDPRSGAAQVARKRLSREAPSSLAGPGSRGPAKAAEMPASEASTDEAR